MLKYKIALVNVWWTQGGEDTISFKSVSEQTSYFNNLASGKLSPLANFNMGDNIRTSVYYKDVSNRSPEELCRCNYAILIKYEETNNELRELERRYFFAKASQDSHNQMFVTLDLDDIQTNYIYKNYRALASGTFKRSHLNRFIDNGNGTVKFSNDQHIYDYEDLNYNKRLIKRTPLKFKYGNSDLNNWLDNYVDYWVYVFIDPSHNYVVRKASDNTSETDLNGFYLKYLYYGGADNLQDSETGVIYYPVFKNGGKIHFYYPNSNNFIDIRVEGEQAFRNKNNNTSYYFSKKCSMIFKDLIQNYEISGSTLNIKSNYTFAPTDAIIDNNSVLSAICTNVHNTLGPIGLFVRGRSGGKVPLELDYEMSENYIFNKSDIIGSNLSEEYEPKINSNVIKYLTIATPSGDNGTYDKQRIDNKNITIYYDEPLLDDITRYYARLKPTGLYAQGTDENYAGVSGSCDNSLPVVNDNYSSYIANNKNFALQNASNIVLAGAIGALGVLFAPSSLAMIGSIGGIAGASIKAITTTDNLQNAPGQKPGASGSFIFNANIMKPRLYIEEYEVLSSEKSSFLRYLQKYGYKYDEWGYLKDYDNTRIQYNYLQCLLDESSGNFLSLSLYLSNEELKRLKVIFERGIRFWHYDTSLVNYIPTKYNKENYERNLLTFSDAPTPEVEESEIE